MQERLVSLVGADNFRDLGGYPTFDGRSTRWGHCFRSDAHSELTAADVDVLRALGVQTVVDLRTAGESERDRGGPMVADGARYHHHPVIADDALAGFNGLLQATDLCDRYLWFLEIGAASIAKTFEILAKPDADGVVFHCSAGKDRTGVVAALLLACLGVDRHVIVADYAFTATRLDRIHDRIRRHPAFQAGVHDLSTPMFQVEAETMIGFLDAVDDRFGGADGWCVSAGVAADTLDRLRDLLLV